MLRVSSACLAKIRVSHIVVLQCILSKLPETSHITELDSQAFVGRVYRKLSTGSKAVVADCARTYESQRTQGAKKKYLSSINPSKLKVQEQQVQVQVQEQQDALPQGQTNQLVDQP